MNDDEFEKKLRALPGILNRPDPTAAWKADILARARREASTTPIQRNLPPRWLMLGWAAMWMAILALNFSTPGGSVPDPSLGSRTSKGLQGASNSALGQDELPTLLAYQRRNESYLDLP